MDFLCPNDPVPKHTPGFSHIKATQLMYILTFSCKLCMFSNESMPMWLSPFLIKHTPAPVLKDISAPTVHCNYMLICLNAIYLNLHLHQRGSVPMPLGPKPPASKCFCFNVPLLQRPMPQRVSVPMPLCSNAL